MATINFLAGKLVSLKDDGAVNAGGKVYWTVADGTFSTPITTYSDQFLSVANANPLILDAAGRGKAYFGGNADVKITTSADVTIYTERNVSPQNVKTVYTKSTDFTIDSTYLDSITETTAVLTATLSSAATLGAGFQITIINTAASAITLARANAGNTINGAAANITIPANSASTITVNFGTTGFITNTVGYPVSIANGGTGSTSAATARTALDVGGLSVSNTWTGLLQTYSGVSPATLVIETDAGVNSKNWYNYVDAGVYRYRIYNDALSASVDYISITRNALTVTDITLAAGTVSITNALAVGTTINGITVASGKITGGIVPLDRLRISTGAGSSGSDVQCAAALSTTAAVGDILMISYLAQATRNGIDFAYLITAGVTSGTAVFKWGTTADAFGARFQLNGTLAYGANAVISGGTFMLVCTTAGSVTNVGGTSKTLYGTAPVSEASSCYAELWHGS